MNHTLIERLISRIPVVNLYPTKHPRKVKNGLKYIHVSTVPQEIKDNNGVVHTVLVGVTYYKEKE